ncbi:Hypothetical predicted protein [Olea europaea subsp. europaea]|uniref:Uncharacterized protein n=1 Tax=Olea europaea subsp. europaea TaxID=158383 RepID=A0A8S0URV3_OLEEU|nr:Hypothetical predicted protein [Olea europaea subsp. europaea]
MSCIKSDQHKKMNLIMRLQGEIRTDLLDIKSNMKLMSDSIAAMISSSMNEVMNKISEKFSTQPIEVIGINISREVQALVDSIISDVMKDNESETKEGLLVTAPSSGLSMKRAPRPAKALQYPYVVAEGKQIKSSGHVVLFEHYNQNVDDVDVADFQNWFQQGYKPHNK